MLHVLRQDMVCGKGQKVFSSWSRCRAVKIVLLEVPRFSKCRMVYSQLHTEANLSFPFV